MRRGNSGFEKLLHGLIMATGFYIIYRGSGILAETGGIRRILSSQKTAEVLQEAAEEWYMPVYRSTQKYESGRWTDPWMQSLLPLLHSWEAQAVLQEDLQKGTTVGAETERDSDGGAMIEGEARAKDKIKAGTGRAAEDIAGGEMPGEVGAGTEMDAGIEAGLEAGTEAGIEAGTEAGTKEGTEARTEVGTEARTEEGAEEGNKTETGRAESRSGGGVGTGTEVGGKAAESEASGETESESILPVAAGGQVIGIPEALENFDYLLNHYFVVDSDTMVDESQLDARSLLEVDLSMEKQDAPQILIYHTHSQEGFIDSVEGDLATGIVSVGTYLAEILETKYGYRVLHDTGVYDLVDGVLDRSKAYDYAREAVEKILEENPSVEVVLDLHRDGVEGHHFVAEENGKPTAQIMFFNGLSQNSAGQAISYLENPYIKENLAFSFQLQLTAQEAYPGYTRNIYLKGQRFNLHLRPRSLLVEAGTQLNTLEEEKNAMEPLADILDQVLCGKNRIASGQSRKGYDTISPR